MTRALLILAAATLSLASCEQLQGHQSAQALLRAFCNLHQSEIIQVLLTPEQQQAGRIVCNAMGMRMGTEP